MTSLRANAAWALAGNVGYTACQWAVLVVVARLGTAVDVGRLALGLALSAPVVILANLQLRAVQATDARREESFGVYLALRLATSAAALVAIAGLAIGLGYDDGTRAVVLAIAVAKVLESVSDVIFGLLQQAERLRRIAVSQLTRGVLTVAAVAAALGSTGSLVVATVAMAIVWGLWLAAYDLPSAACLAAIRPRFDGAALRRVARLALPLGCVSFLNSMTANVPRYAIDATLGTAALGRYAALAYLVVATTQPVLALGAATTPRLARYFVTDRAAYRALAGRGVLVSAAFGLAMLAAVAGGGRAVLAVSYGPEYAAEAPLLIWLAAAGALGFVSSALGYAVTAARRFPAQLAVALLACSVCALASHVLVPRYGMPGAAGALLCAETTRLACLAALYAATATTRPVALPDAVAA